jgi:muramoyltetrapeptide carboxypeptidase
MNRRELLKTAAVAPFSAPTLFAQKSNVSKIVKPPRLKVGDTVSVIAPASGLSPEAFDRAIKNLETLGFKTRIGKFARQRKSYLSATDAERLADLHAAFADKETAAVWCVRGGYGTTRILPLIDYDLIRKNPKVFIGFSDVTALHVAISQNCGLVSFHGPVASSIYTDYTRNHVLNVLTNPFAPYKIEVAPDNKTRDPKIFATATITPGTARGRLIGGNLSMLAALAGTPFALKDVKDKILFIEDVDEQPYRVDRMLTQLGQTVDLRQAAGIALGIFTDSRAEPGESTVVDVLREKLCNFKIPVVYGLSIGHIRDQFTLPIGIRVELDANRATMTFLETAVS